VYVYSEYTSSDDCPAGTGGFDGRNTGEVLAVWTINQLVALV